MYPEKLGKHPESAPFNLKPSHLEADPLTVDRSEFSTLENLVFDFHRILAGIYGRYEVDFGEEISLTRKTAPDFLKPDTIEISDDYMDGNYENQTGYSLSLTMTNGNNDRDVSLFIQTEAIPSPDPDDGGEEVIDYIELVFSVDSTRAFALEAGEPVDSEIAERFRNTLQSLERMLEFDYELES